MQAKVVENLEMVKKTKNSYQDCSLSTALEETIGGRLEVTVLRLTMCTSKHTLVLQLEREEKTNKNKRFLTIRLQHL